jgi:predicted enzyme related to lactoylglutathione lyase
MGQPVIYFELGCKNSHSAVNFYSELFGWTNQKHDSAAMISTGHLNVLGPHQNVTIYVQVDDLQTLLDKAVRLGGRTLVPPTAVPGIGHLAWVRDTEGFTIGLWKPAAGELA